MIRKTLPLLLALALTGCIQFPERKPKPVLDENGVEVLPTNKVYSEDDLLS